MPEYFRLLDCNGKNIEEFSNASCFASIKNCNLFDSDYKDTQYLEVYNPASSKSPCFSATLVSEENREKFKPYVEAVKELLKIEVIHDENEYSYKIDITKYPADCVMSFLRCMSIIKEGGSISYCMDIFNSLIRKGISTKVAVVACVLIGSYGENSKRLGLTSSRYSVNHSPVYDDNITVKTLQQLQTGNWRLNPQQKPLKEQGGYFYGYSSLIGDYQFEGTSSTFFQYSCKHKMKASKFHPLEFPVLYLLQYKYGKTCDLEQYVQSIVELSLSGNYNTNTDWICSMNSQLREEFW